MLTCDLCDGTFAFQRDAAGHVSRAIYSWDRFDIRYDRVLV